MEQQLEHSSAEDLQLGEALDDAGLPLESTGFHPRALDDVKLHHRKVNHPRLCLSIG